MLNIVQRERDAINKTFTELETHLAVEGIQLEAGIEDFEEEEAFFLPQPHTVEEVGISMHLLAELALKEIYFAGRPTGLDVSTAMALPFSVIEGVLDFLRRESLVVLTGSQSPQRQFYEYSLTDRGRDRVNDSLLHSQYRGQVPVPLVQYSQVVREQSFRKHIISREKLQHNLSHLVLNQKILNLLGPAVNSGQSIFLYGPSGNGKTSIATSLGRMLSKSMMLIPYAVEVGGQIVKVFDPAVHQTVGPTQAPERRADAIYQQYQGPERRRDMRWVICKRPAIVAGGELTMERLELQYDEHANYHLAPLQMKANGGLLLIDDFGRQRMPARDLLNRWIVPMDRRVDYLTLHTGETIEVPFDLLLVFATNLKPADLFEEAFLRRVRYKILVQNPKENEFREIFRRGAKAKGLAIEEELLNHLINRFYREAKREMRAYQPWDLLQYVEDISHFEGHSPQLTNDILYLAAEACFGDGSRDLEEGMGGDGTSQPDP
ncbi:MAG: ATP-binding protein [Chloroflexi bacterium]|nr:ATP-binding protein [Chloroflexota bacterium]